MSPAQWKSLLITWSAQLLTTDLTRHLDDADQKLKYLGFTGASDAAVESLEARLGVTLPPSYRNFLKTSDGFRVISPFIYHVRSAVEVDWFRVENQGWIETYNEPTPYDNAETREPADEEYFDYSKPNDHNFRSSHLWAMLQVSDINDGVMLLNPLAVTPDGEWEAWFFANWIPGAHRYASFAHMMVETYRSLRKIEKLSNTPKLPAIKIPRAKIPRHSVVNVPEPAEPKKPRWGRKKGQSQLEYVAQFLTEMEGETIAPAPPELVNLLNDLKNPDDKARAKTIRILHGKLKVRAMSKRHPDLIPLAVELAEALPDPEARLVCVSVLTNITPDGAVPAWLMTALSDPHPWVLTTALYAVYYFHGPELLEPIIRIVSSASDMQLSQQAIQALSEIPDRRAVPVLAAQLERDFSIETLIPDEQARKQVARQYYVTITLALSKYGVLAVPHLTKLLSHLDPNRRVAAIIGLRALGEPSSRALVKEMEDDSDSDVRHQAGICATSWGNAPGFRLHILS